MPSALQVVARFLQKTGEAAPLPSSLQHETGLMTKDEYLEHRNPSDRHHPSDAYDFSFTSLNKALTIFDEIEWGGSRYEVQQPYGGGEGFAFLREGHLVGVLHRGTMYHSNKVRPQDIPPRYRMGADWKDFDIDRYKVVKYPSESLPLISNVAKRNRKEYNHLIQHIRVKGEPYEIRSEGKPKTNRGTTLAILDSKSQLVAQGSNEWGATLVVVAREYRGKGLGNILLEYWYRFNPAFTSGGYTESGEALDLRIWEDRVKEFLSNGWYSELVRQKKLTVNRVREILAGTSKRHRFSPLPSDKPSQAPSKKVKSQILVYAEDFAFVVYDSAFLSDPDEKHIYGYGFFRDSPSVGDFLFTIDYDRSHWKLTTLVAFQMAKDNGSKVYVGKGYGDIVELKGISEIEREGDYAFLTRNVLPLRQWASLERRIRRKMDSYDEKKILLLEMGESKWR